MTQQLNNVAYGGTNADHGVLDAINEVLESIGEMPVTAIPSSSSGSAIQNRALKFLERVNIDLQTGGFPENTRFAQSENLASLSALTGQTLAIKAAGKDGHRTLVLRRSDDDSGPEVWDADAGAVLSSTTVCIDIIDKVDFHKLSIGLQNNIIATAAQLFQRRLQGSPSADQALSQERQLADLMTERISPVKRNVPMTNIQSPFAGQQQQQQQQQG